MKNEFNDQLIEFEKDRKEKEASLQCNYL